MSDLISLGAFEHFPDQQSRGFECQLSQQQLDGFVVRQGHDLFAYLNRCPHTGAPLNWCPDQFLTRTGEHIQCSLHGALFDISSGKCLAGPCVGQALSPIPVTVEGGEVVLNVGALKPLG